MTAPVVSARRIGREGQPLVTIDGFAADPDALRTAAIATPFGAAREYYPGSRGELPPAYLKAQWPLIAAVLAEVFGYAHAARMIDASFSLVTRRPDDLSVAQRMPHVDAVEPGRIAILHYLAPAGGDGTAFFRHRSTGFETVDAARAPVYHGQLEAELRHGGGPGPAYIAGDTPLFERTALAEARYNRALIYRSNLLHSGAISPGAVLPADPATGRLTITAFLEAS